MNGRNWGRGLAVAAVALGCSLYASASVDSNVSYPAHYGNWAFAKASAALQRARTRLKLQAHDNSHIVSLLENIAAPSRYLRRLALRASGKTWFVNVVDIDWIRAAENYVQPHTRTQRHLLHVPIGTLEASLDPQLFLRISSLADRQYAAGQRD